MEDYFFNIIMQQLHYRVILHALQEIYLQYLIP
jgi:hypothetical protein